MALLLSISIVSGSAAQTEHQTGIIGLLTLPQLSGEVDCEPPAPREVSLHAQPRSSDIVGSMRAHKDSSDADCYRAILKVHRPDGSVRDLPTEEYEEERPRAAIVVEVRDRWFKVRLEDGAAWLEASPLDDYMALEELLVLRPAHLTQAWDGKLAASPGGPSRRGAR